MNETTEHWTAGQYVSPTGFMKEQFPRLPRPRPRRTPSGIDRLDLLINQLELADDEVLERLAEEPGIYHYKAGRPRAHPVREWHAGQSCFEYLSLQGGFM